MVFPKEPWWLKELQRCACTLSSEPTPESDQQTSDRPSPAERGTRKPFDRFPGLALSAEALPDCGAVCRLCDMDTSDREHWGALACVWRFAKSFGIGCFKGDPLQAAPEYVVDVNSPHGGTSQLAGTLRRAAALCLVRCCGVHCRRWMPLDLALLQRRAHAARDLTSAGREADTAAPREEAAATADVLRLSRPPL